MNRRDHAIEGVIVAAITPRRAGSHTVDLGATYELIDYVSELGVNGIALLGSTGEFVHFDIQDRMRFFGLAVKRSRVPILANVSYSTLDGAVELALESAGAGVAGVLLMPPYFFRYSQETIKQFYLQFAAQIGATVRIFIYNIPFFTNPMTSETLVELLSTGLFAGIKDSSGDWEIFSALKALRDQRPFTLLVGNDTIFTRAREAGAQGVVSGVACGIPELMVGIDRSIASGSSEKTAQLEARLQEYLAWLELFPAPMGIKETVAARGWKTGALAVPLGEGEQAKLREFRAWLETWLPPVIKESLHAW